MADMINQLPHYLACRPQVEPIDLTENFDFCVGNFFKYFPRAGLKEGNPKEEDLKKAINYLRREIDYLSSFPYEGCASDPISARGLSYFYWLRAIHPYLESIFVVHNDKFIYYSNEGLRSLIERLEKMLEAKNE